jgi:hypothetical protein
MTHNRTTLAIRIQITVTTETADNIKDSFYGELGRIFDQSPRYDTKILLGDLSAKVGTEDIFKLTIRNLSSYKISNDNGVK